MEDFDKKNVLKVYGISQFVRDQIEKEIQKENNSIEYRDDVNKLWVCPDGKDYVLVELANDTPADKKKLGGTLRIGGTELKVERWNSQTPSSDDYESESVSKIWQADEATITLPLYGNTTNSVGGKVDQNKGAKKVFGKEARHQMVYKRRFRDNPDQDKTSETLFNNAKVEVNDNFVKKIKEAEFQDILEDQNVKYDKGYLSGTWNGIHAVGHYIASYFTGSENGKSQGNGSSDSCLSSYDQSSGSPSLKVVKSKGVQTSTIDQPPPSNRPDETFSVNSLFLRYILRYHYEVFEKLENVSKEIGFEEKTKCDKDLKITARKEVNREKFSEIVNEFIDFYQRKHQNMYQENVRPTSKIDQAVISETRLKFCVVIDSTMESDIVIYGEKDKVLKAKEFLQSKVGDSHPGSSSGRPVPSKPNHGTAEEKVAVEKLSCVLFKNIRVSVYQGDITKETADVIVNPANEDLKHSGGAAEAVVKAGGKSIQDESDDIMKKRRYHSLNPGQVVATKAGNLPCNLIIHAVGPRWHNYQYQRDAAKNILYWAVMNCLTVASYNGANSISIPAISSGIFGVPVQICAEMLFTAVTAFSKNAPESNSLQDIRFVNIDQQTTQVFAQEIQKRFGVTVKRENVEVSGSSIAGGNKTPNRNEQSRTAVWKENAMIPDKGTGTTDPKTKVTYEGNIGSRAGNQSTDNKEKKSSLNPNADPYSSPTSRSPSSSTHGSYSSAVTGKKEKEKDANPGPHPKAADGEECTICLCSFTEKTTLKKCGHSFCAGCIYQAFKHQKKCPLCFQVYGTLTGDQPDGKMIESYQPTSLPGFKSCGTIVITYIFEGGIQGPNHPNPGQRYRGTRRTAYLPDNAEGRKVLALLKKAFDQKLTFTIGRSSTTGENNVITWNDIHHKTSQSGGSSNFGYPDPDYLKRVQEELAAKGIIE